MEGRCLPRKRISSQSYKKILTFGIFVQNRWSGESGMLCGGGVKLYVKFGCLKWKEGE